jgi:arogenate dehydrogenase (NADP+)
MIFKNFGFILILFGKSSNALDINRNPRKHNKVTRQFDILDSIRSEALFASMPSSSFSSKNEDSLDGRQDRPIYYDLNGLADDINGSTNDNDDNKLSPIGRLEELKQQEAELARQLAEIRMEKLSALRSKPLTIGVVGFGRFGQFIAKTLGQHGKIVVTSRSDYTDIANDMGAEYVPLSEPELFLEKNLDVIILATSIVSFEDTVKSLTPHLRDYVSKTNKGPLLVDVLSVKEHARDILLEHLPEECDILCTHPMFGPDSGKNGWKNLNFVFEKTRVDKVVFDPSSCLDFQNTNDESFNEAYSYTESMDRIERFLSIWEEEGCRMVPLSCKSHDEYAANSQFITHLMGRILGAQGLQKTPIDTKGFESVLKLIDSTTADSFDLFYGLYKFNKKNSLSIIHQLQNAMEDVVENLKILEKKDFENHKIRQDATDKKNQSTSEKEQSTSQTR